MRLEEKQVTAYYDPETHILHVAYRNILSPEVSTQFYGWLLAGIMQFPNEISQARGSVYDFRAVTQFDNASLSSTQRDSKIINQQADFSKHPVALLIANPIQEEYVRLTIAITPGSNRKRVVYSPEEALAFIEIFHRNRSV
jgi:hypothetical protein